MDKDNGKGGNKMESKKVSYPELDKLFEKAPKGYWDRPNGDNGTGLKKKKVAKKGAIKRK